MNASLMTSSEKEVNISIKESDVGTLYIIQHELLQDSGVDFAGVIVKHPLTNECWMKVRSSKSDPIEKMKKATDAAIANTDDLKKLFNAKIKG
ncbi:MAG: hypothetical protein GWN01_07910 [Nitrosopumilaceae archaeon]|nr:hypothetical protein [Nitrosopumilaceae archaeon]NIU00845.1 hypothetical protein [Nitrosopumilaceae archaeon]NIU87298.1 hypothetical protein [Nitrosopumilaceae archaeon]NIV65826.1 hypothetical protein [Nitrosopumilaceae archaeon]NIX61447.1 hypothetical protein [Nitrosopumilaceae archaeon]